MSSNYATSSPHDKGGWPPRRPPVGTAWILLVLSLLLLASCASQTSTGGPTQQTPTTTGKRLPTQATTASLPTPSHGGITFLQMIDPMTGWAVTSDARHLLRTTDGGSSWKEVTPRYSASLQDLEVIEDFLSASLAWVALAGHAPPVQVFRTRDGGQTWQLSTVQTTGQLGQITFLDPQHGWLLSGIVAAAGPKAVDVFRTTNGGKTWIKVSTASPTYTSPGALPPGAQWLTFLNASTGWAIGASPFTTVWLYVTHDGGSTWQHQTLQPPAPVVGDISTRPITFFTANDGVLPTCSSAGTDIYVTHNGGTIWNSTSLLPLFQCAVDVFVGASDFIDSNHGWVLDNVATNAPPTGLYMTSDGGAHWIKLTTSTNFHDIQKLDFVSDTVGWAIGAVTSETPFLLKTMDGGRTWTQVPYTLV